jgi:WhiB family transcriptional regulator, redox-sensing transcriptional regulator
VLTSLVPATTTRDSFGIDPFADLPLEAFPALEPLAKDCPEDLPCRVADADLWFAETPAELEQAKALCAGCPARLACLAGALERREPWGVWGGEIFERGAIIARKRPRGRPRKHDPNRADEVAA